ncbi:sugar ABC transporter ATP-binding protein [Actinokineospora enzanensis]|uniref:sugar ABC transporter ATP-binding protein n=1 Tax=Actinokineospora enzanensis TaxID=155975 RepID=UPI00037E38E7|nr:sugar ABC transporter ATP-binding protein [Actinokineospora enzanensis]
MTVTLSGISKRYGATLALDKVDLTIHSGQVHALLGHNGAGKSTLIKCLGGGTQPSGGRIDLDGTTVPSLTPADAIRHGVAVIYQHLSLIGTLSVAENVFLGNELTRRGLVRRAEQRRRTEEALARVGFDVDPDTRVDELPIGRRQQVEIAKALLRDARLLILDEPTASLSPEESRRLAALVPRLRDQGIAILYVTHLLGEVMRLADRATVLRDGRVAWASGERGFTKDDLVTAISGAPMTRTTSAPRAAGQDTVPRLRVDRLDVGGPEPQSLRVSPGEIVCLYGLVGSGRTRLLEHVAGARRPVSGRVEVDGAAVEVSSPRAALRGGIAFVPADRARQGLFGTLPAGENVLIRAMSALRRGPMRSFAREREVFAEIGARMSLRPLDRGLPTDRFSGGNQQKLLIARWANGAAPARVLLLDDPTQGVDVGARTEIYGVLRVLAEDTGLAVLFATNEPEEALALAHRVVVMRGGRLLGSHHAADLDEETLLNLIHQDPRKAAAR